jgi:hypothetical protein
MKPTPKVFASRLAPEHFAARPVAAAATLILAMTAQALPLSYLIELERAKIEPASKLFQQEGGGHADSKACKEQRDALVKALDLRYITYGAKYPDLKEGKRPLRLRRGKRYEVFVYTSTGAKPVDVFAFRVDENGNVRQAPWVQF